MSDVNIKDVAKYAGVSAITVTRTIKTPDLVSEKTKQKVINAIEKLDYVPNYSASVLRSAKSNAIGITLFDIENPFMSRLVMNLEKSLKKYNYSILMTFANEETTNDYELYTKLKTYNVDLSIFIPTNYNEKLTCLPKNSANKCLQLFRSVYKNIDSFTIDDIEGTYLATKHLIKNGHKNILLIDYDQRIPLHRDRGFKKAFNEFDLDFNKNNILLLSEFDDSQYIEKIIEKIKEQKPTAVLAVTQKLCVDSLNAFEKLKLKLYDDISLVCYDDTVFTKCMDITSVSHPFNVMIDIITDWIVQKIHNLDKQTNDRMNMKVTPYLEIRKSVKNLNKYLK